VETRQLLGERPIKGGREMNTLISYATEGSVAMPSCRQLDEDSCWDIT
jgi:hypothetical protein